MLRRIALALATIFLFSSVAVAQSPSPSPKAAQDFQFQIPPRAVIKANEFVEVDKSIIFDASQSFAIPVEGEDIIYSWDFGDGNSDKGSEVIHTYRKPGQYTVTLNVKNADGDSTEKMEVFAYNKLILFITDNSAERESIEAMRSHALREGVFLKIVQSFDVTPEFVSEEDLIQKLGQSKEEIQSANQIVIWTKSSSGLKMISRLPVELEEAEINYSVKDIFFVTEEGISTISRIARGSYKLFQPRQIIITRKEALYPLIEQSSTEKFLTRIKQRAIPFASIDSESEPLGFLSFMTHAINYLIEKNIPINSIILVLMLPVIVTVIAFVKQVIGLSTLGVYTPAIITLSFLALDLKLGLIFLLAILAVGSLTHVVFKRYRLLYIPKMAILLTIVSLTIIGILAIGASLNISRLVSISIFPMLIMSTLAEKFVSIQGAKGLKSALYIIIETILVSIIAYIVIGGEVDLVFFTIKFEFIRTLIFGYPELIFLFLIINIFLGRWTGLRLNEYIRFRDILRRAEE